MDIPRGVDPEVVNNRLGCVSYTRYRDALNGSDAGLAPLPAALLPYCNPANGLPSSGPQ